MSTALETLEYICAFLYCLYKEYESLTPASEGKYSRKTIAKCLKEQIIRDPH